MADENDAQPIPAAETPAPTPVEQPVAAEEQSAPTEQPSGQEASPAAEAKPKSTGKPFQNRIDQLTREKHEAARELATVRAERDALKAAQQPPAPEGQQPPNGTQPQPRAPLEQFNDELINRRAAQLVEQRMMQERVNATLTAGHKEFSDFNDRCNTVASLGGSERPDFLSVVTDPSIIPDGHKVIASLAEQPEEAARILSLPPVQMSAALARYAEGLNKPKAAAISKAPMPIKPLNGSAKASDEPSPDDDEDTYFRKREAQMAAKKAASAGRSL